MRPGGRRLPRLLLAALAPVVIALAVAAAAAAPEGSQPPPDAAWHPPAAYAQTPPPRAANVTSDAQSRVYHLGERIEIDVGFDKAVVIDPAAPPSLVVGLDGGVNRTAGYSSGNNTAELTFAYTVQYGDVSSDLDYNGTSSLRGSLAGAGGAAANTTLPRPGSPDSLAGSGDILVDYAAPRLIAADRVTGPWQRGFGAIGGFYDSDVIRVENRTYALAGNSHGLFLFRVHEDGTVSQEAVAGSSGSASYSRGVDTFTVNGSAYAIAALWRDSGVQLFRVHGNGTLEALGSIFDDDELRLERAAGIAAFDLNGTMHALVASWIEKAVQLIRVHGNGTLEARGSWSLVDDDDLALKNAHGVAAFDLNGTMHALVTGHSDHGVELIRVHGNGTLEPRDRLVDGTLLKFAYRVTAFDLNGSTHALAVGLGGHAAQLIRVHDNGTLEALGSARNGHGFDRLGGSANVDVFSGASGGTYAAVAARGGGQAVQLVSVREDGNLFAAGSAHRYGGFPGLTSPVDVNVFALGGGTYALAVGWTGNGGFELMRLSPAYPARVTSAAADAAYGTGSEIPIAVRFDGPVRVEGDPPDLRLGSGATAPFLSGNNSNTLVFNYTVRQGEHAADLEHAGTDALSSAGAITDVATGLPANRTLPPHGSGRSLADLKDIIIDGRVPPVVSVNSTAADGLYNTTGAEINVTVAYESAVRVAGPLHLRLNTGGSAHYLSGNNTAELVFRYTVGPDESVADLDYAGLNTILGSGTIADATTGLLAGRALPPPGSGNTLADLRDITIDTRAPSVVSVTSEDGAYGAGREITVTVEFSERVAYSGAAPVLNLNFSGSPRAAAYDSGNGTTGLDFSYVVRAGDRADDLGYHGTAALVGSVTDLAGHPVPPLPSPGAPGSLSHSRDILVDPAVPLLIAAGSASAGDPGFAALSYSLDVDTVRAGNRTYAVVASHGDNAVQLVRVHDNGTMEAAGEAQHGADPTLDMLDRPEGIDAFETGDGGAYAIVASRASSGIQTVRIHGNDTLQGADSLGDNTTLTLGGVNRVAAFDMGGEAHALVTSGTEGGVQLVRVRAGDGAIEARGSLSEADDASLRLGGAYGVAAFDLGGEKHALVAGHADNGVQLVRVRAGDGAIEARGSLGDNDSLALGGPLDVAAFYMGGEAHAVVASGGEKGVQLVRVRAGDGALEARGSATEGERGFDELDGARGIAAFELGGAAYAAVASRADNGVQLVRVRASDGALLAAGSAANGAPGFDGLGGAYGIHTFALGGRTYAIAASAEGHAVQLIELSPVAVANVTSAAGGGPHGRGAEIDIAVAFDRPVLAEGPLKLRLDSGGTAVYHSGSGNSTLVFRYTVGPDEEAADLEYAGVNALSGSGTIVDAATGLPAGRALPPPGSGNALGDLEDIAVDAKGPSVESVTSVDGAYGAGRTITVTVRFNEQVAYSGAAPVLSLNVSGSPRAAAYESGNGTTELDFSYVVRAGDRADDLAYYNATALAGSVADIEGNPAGALPLPGAPGSLSRSRNVLVDYATPPLIAAGSARDQTPGFAALSYSLDVDTVRAGNRTYAVVASHGDNAVQLVRVHDNGTLGTQGETAEARNGADPTLDMLDRPEGIDAFETGDGGAYAIVASRISSGIQTVRIHGNDTLQGADSLGDNTTLTLGGVNRVAAFDMGGETHALVTSGTEGGVQLVRVRSSDGAIEARGFLADNASLRLGGAYGVAAFDLGGEKHALVAGHGDSGVQLVRMRSSDGSLEARGSLGDNASLALGGPRDVAAFDMGGEVHAVVASEGEKGVQLVRVRASDGAIEARGSATEGARGFDELDGARGIAAFELGGEAYAAVASRADDGVQLVRVRATDGALFAAGSATNGAPGFGGLGGAHGIHAFALGGRTYAIVASAEGHAIQLVRLSTASVANVTSTAGGGPHVQGAEIDIRVAFDAPVNVTGPIDLLLNSGGAARYISGENGTAELVFRYTVGQGEQVAVLDYAGAHALRAGPGGAIIEAKGGPGGAVHHANTALPPPGSPDSLGGAAAIEVDAAPPRAVSASSPNATGPHGLGDTIHIAVNFSEPVTVRGLPLLALDTGQPGRSAEYASGSGGRTLLFTYTVAAGDDSPTGLDYAGASALSLGPGGAIIDGAGNGANLALPAPGSAGSLAATSGLWVDGVRPTAASVSSPNATGPHGRGDTIHIAVNFSETVTVRGTPLLALDTGQPGRAAEYASGSGSAALLFLYTVAAGDDSPDLDYAGASALSLGPGGAIIDGAGNGANLALPARGSGASLGDTSDVSVRGGSPGGGTDAAATATARAAFTAPNTVRIEYSGPLGAPASHSGPVYGAVAIRGGASADPLGESGLGTKVHTVGFGGDGVAADQDGSIALNTRLEGAAAGGAPAYEFAAGSIPVAAGRTVHTLAPAVLAPVVPIEPDGFVRAVNVVDGGDPARPSINVSALVPAGGGPAVFPDSAGGVGVVTSFAEVWFPPGVRASGVPADGLIGLRVWGDAPGRESLAGRVAAALGAASPGDLVLQRVVEAGGAGGARIAFDMPVRVLLDGQAGGTAFYASGADGPIVPIRTECTADNTTAVHAQLGGSGECQVDSGGDKAVHTYHLTLFGTARGLTDLERAVALAPPGGTVLVPPGTYAGDVLIVDRPLAIMPADPADPPVFTGYSHIVVRPSADGPVAVSGLRFEDTTHTSGGEGLASIVVESLAGSEPGMPVAVRNNTFSNTCDGGVRAAADAGAPPIAGLDVSGNRFYGIGANAAACASSPSAPDRADAIVLGRHGAFTAGSGTPQLAGLAVRDNYIFGTTYTGIRVAGAAGALIEGNHIEGVPDDGIRVLPSSNVTVRGNTIVDANHRPHLPDRHDGADGAAIEVWAGSDDIAVTLNRISASAGALAVCAGTCDPGADAADGTGGDPVPVARAELGSADGANDVRFNHNVLAASNAAPLVASGAGGVLDARANYYPGRAESVAGGAGIAAAPGASIDHLPALGGGPVRIGAVVADGANSSVRSIDAAAAAGFAAGADAFNAGQAAAGGTVGIEPVAHRVGSPDAAYSKDHKAALAALLAGAGGDGRMRPVLENSIAKAMDLYDAGPAAGLAAITAMESGYGHYPFVTARDGTVVAHGADPSLVGRADIVPGIAGGTDGLRALYDFADGSASTGIQGYPNASWKWWAYEFADPSAGSGAAPQQKRSMIALHAGPDGAAGTADDLVFGAGYYPPGAPRHLFVAAGDAAAAADRTGASGVVVSPTSTASNLAAAGDALFRLVPPDSTGAGVVAGLIAGDGVARAVVTSDNASLESRSMAAALASSSSGLPAAGVRAEVVAFNSSEDGWAGPAMERIGAAVTGGGSGGGTTTAVVYTGRAAALADLAALPGAAAAPASSVRWYAAGGLDRAALGEPAPALARTTGLAAVSQHAEPSAPVDAALGAAGIKLDASTRGPAYAAYDAAFLLGASISAAGQGAPASAAAAHMAGAALNRTDSALGGRLALDTNGDLALPDRYAVSRVGPDGSWAAAAGGPLLGTGTCAVSIASGSVSLGSVEPGRRSQAAAETVVNIGTRQFAGDGVSVSAGPWRYDGAGAGQAADLDAGLTMYRVQPGADYASVGAAGTALPRSDIWPGERLEVQYILDLTSMPALAAGTASQVITYSAECQ